MEITEIAITAATIIKTSCEDGCPDEYYDYDARIIQKAINTDRALHLIPESLYLDEMTPEQYVILRDKTNSQIAILNDNLKAVFDIATREERPLDLRRAEAKDITPGKVIWYPRHVGGGCWHIVDDVMDQGDAFKAFTAEDGCRYGLVGAYVRTDSPE